MRHELHLLGRGLAALTPAAVLLVSIGAVWAGPRGVASVLLGIGVVAGNQAAAALSTGWARTLRFRVLAVGYGLFVVRMIGMFAFFAAMSVVPWVHQGLLAAAFCGALVVMLTAECWSYVRKSYVPSWRLAP